MRLVAHRGRDLRRAREARAHFRDFLVERDDDLEVRRLRGRVEPAVLDRAVADLGHLAGERLTGHRVDRDLGRLPNLDARNVGLVDLDFRLDDRHVGDRQQHGAGVVHRADDDRFPLLDVAARDDAVDRRLDAHLAQIEARALRRRALGLHPQLLRAELLFLRPQIRLAQLEFVLRALERLARRQARPSRGSAAACSCPRPASARPSSSRSRLAAARPASSPPRATLRCAARPSAGCADRSAAGTAPW